MAPRKRGIALTMKQETTKTTAQITRTIIYTGVHCHEACPGLLRASERGWYPTCCHFMKELYLDWRSRGSKLLRCRECRKAAP